MTPSSIAIKKIITDLNNRGIEAVRPRCTRVELVIRYNVALEAIAHLCNVSLERAERMVLMASLRLSRGLRRCYTPRNAPEAACSLTYFEHPTCPHCGSDLSDPSIELGSGVEFENKKTWEEILSEASETPQLG